MIISRQIIKFIKLLIGKQLFFIKFELELILRAFNYEKAISQTIKGILSY